MKPVFIFLSLAFALSAAEPVPDPKELPRIPFTAAKDARKTFTVKEGIELQLAAAEPLVADPVAMCFDEFGRGVGMAHDEDVSGRRAEHVRKGLQITGVIGQHGEASGLGNWKSCLSRAPGIG